MRIERMFGPTALHRTWATAAIAGAGAVGGGILGGLSKNKVKTDPYGTLNPEQKAILQAVGPRLLGDVNKDYTDYLYKGQLSEGIGAGEQDVVGRNARMNAIAENTYGTLGNYNDPAFNEQFDTEIARPTLQSFQNEIAPYLAQELPSFGTQRAQVISRNLGELQNNILQQRFSAREAAKNRALQAVGDSAGYFQTAAGIQAIPRQIKQAGLDREYQNYIQANAHKANSLNNALAFLGLETKTQTSEPNAFSRIASGALAGGTMGFGIGNALQQNDILRSLIQGQGSNLTFSPGGNFSNTAPYQRPTF